MNFKYLNKLANIVVSIDEGKNITDCNIIGMAEQGIRLLAQMKSQGMDIGMLQETFAGIQLLCTKPDALPDLLDIAHEEIGRLLGLDEWRVYGYDKWGCFFAGNKFEN